MRYEKIEEIFAFPERLIFCTRSAPLLSRASNKICRLTSIGIHQPVDMAVVKEVPV